MKTARVSECLGVHEALHVLALGHETRHLVMLLLHCSRGSDSSFLNTRTRTHPYQDLAKATIIHNSEVFQLQESHVEVRNSSKQLDEVLRVTSAACC